MIPFNKPYCTGNELSYMAEVCQSDTMSGGGEFTKRCHSYFQNRYGFKKCLLCTSGTDALEMCAMLCNLHSGDEVIVPSYTFVSSALCFIREGATVRFADSGSVNPNITAQTIKPLITPRTRAICVVHYAGVACDMDSIMALARENNLLVIEDAAHAVDAFYTAPKESSYLIPGKRYPLGSIGDLGAFSFHETKNINCGEGGMLVINDESFCERAEIIWEKGTDRARFYRGMVDKYGWCDVGSSFLPSEFTAAFLFAQLEKLEDIQAQRKHIWDSYDKALRDSEITVMPQTPSYASNNYHMYYLLCKNLDERSRFIAYMKENGIQVTFHYLPLHSSRYYKARHDSRVLSECDRYADTLVRLPMFYALSDEDIRIVTDKILSFKNFTNFVK